MTTEHPDTRYPLCWPSGWRVTARPKRSRFQGATIDRSRLELHAEIRRLGGRGLIISTNLKLRLDGAPYASAAASVRSQGLSLGVAIYFQLNGQAMALACDRWDRIEDNMRALAKHVAAIRGQDRWGVGTLQQAFAGYKALPAPPDSTPWWERFGFDSEPSPDTVTAEGIRKMYRKKALTGHPDRGGDPIEFDALTKARDEGLAYASQQRS